MRFFLDQNQSPRLIELLAEHGHDVTHVRDIALGRATDREILARAITDDRIVVSADTDFGDLLAHRNASRPSVILLRRQEGRRAADIAALLAVNLDGVADDLERGAIVVFDDDRVRVRSLPFDENCIEICSITGGGLTRAGALPSVHGAPKEAWGTHDSEGHAAEPTATGSRPAVADG